MKSYEDDDATVQEGRGRSARKREIKQIADLAKRLVEATAGTVENLPFDGELRAALMQTRSITSRIALKRQLKFLTGLLCNDDEAAEIARVALDGAARVHRDEVSDFKKLEMMRDELLDPDRFDAAMQRICDELPDLDRREISSLARSAQKKPSKKLSRAILRTLRAATEDAS